MNDFVSSSKIPGARMVITSDMELNSVLTPVSLFTTLFHFVQVLICDLLKYDTRYPSAEVLVARLKRMYDICLSSTGKILYLDSI